MSEHKRAFTFLCEQGDVTITWDEEDDERIIPVIEKKLAEGVTFFIIEPRLGGLMKPKKTLLKSASEALRHRALTVKDADLQAFVESGQTTETVKTPAKRIATRKRSEDPKEIARSESVGMRPMKGG